LTRIAKKQPDRGQQASASPAISEEAAPRERLSRNDPLVRSVARRTGIPLKIARDIQHLYREYSENKIKPQIDGSLAEYWSLADLEVKNEFLGNSVAMLFPIQRNEPFGLVMVEAWRAARQC
jgi:hypothetical protein